MSVWLPQTNRRIPRRRGLRLALTMLSAALLAGIVGSGCDHSGPARENQPPTAEITTSPVEGDTTSYRLRALGAPRLKA